MSTTPPIVKVIENEKKIMRGEFLGDFTRDTFDPIRHFSRVLAQQGRVQIDADWNEQVSIILHQLRSLACDLGSEHWGPEGNFGFNISPSDNTFDFNISEGHYYVNGLLCEVGDEPIVSYATQPDYPLPEDQTIEVLLENQDGGRQLLVYLDVWERHITYVNDDSIREVALGGPDTATRAKVVWQVNIIPTSVTGTARGIHPLKRLYQTFLEVIEAEIKPGTGKLCAKVKDKTEDDNDPCLVAPESRYRGTENQLYRVEIHIPGVAGEDIAAVQRATFKWSRENASVIFPIINIEDTLVTLEHLGRDCRYGLKANDWVEIVDDDYDLQNRAEPLLQIDSIDDENLQVTLKGSPQPNVGTDSLKHPYLRRWDQNKGDQNGIVVVESSPTGENWIGLEDGIQIQFKGLDEDSQQPPHIYQTGDYWLIPARTATGDVEWPLDENEEPKALLPHGVVHHYAPLAIVTVDTGGAVSVPHDLRRIMKQRWE